MAPKGNNMIPNSHFHKDWQRRIKTWFDQPMRKKRRYENRIKRARMIAPRPMKGYVRPIARCPTIKYNQKVRAGRGFSRIELKRAGINRKQARTIGISVDLRRRNKSMESLQANVQRLKEYRSKLILFPKRSGQRKKGDASEQEMKTASQLSGAVIPITQKVPVLAALQISKKKAAFSPFKTVRKARNKAKRIGKVEKRRREAAEKDK